MNRRQFLVMCGATGVAGCSASEDVETEATPEPAADGGSNQNSGGSQSTQTATPEPTATETPEPTPTGTPTPAGEAQITITAQSLEREEGEFSTTTYAAATVINEADAMSGQIELRARFYNDADEVVTTERAYLAALPGGATWQAVVPVLGDASQVARTEVFGEFNAVGPQTNPDDVSLDESQLEITERETFVTGSATNNRPGPLSYLEATVLFMASENVVLGSNYTNITDLPSGESWRFEVQWLGTSWHPRNAQSHQVFLTTNAL
ncbi:hypothetical protein C2R22_05780 [Salinigranum rubrum]|uniref:Uncharacterized protein n=1 Tax=Salinigranum rubrum TaxID=755307 RepID=A0A2I8VH20_9EURY|nr:FxLYD domain-containing protein [Salinigranum rubrum]AUV81227.1 hypothetical protein C2R22_05780 [Salinigranum rubrum]